MSITLQYFGILAEVTGISNESIELSGTREKVIRAVLEKYPDLAELSFITAVNGKILHEDNAGIQEGDEIALIPPAPGG